MRELLYYFIMRDCMLAIFAVRRKNIHTKPILQRSPNIACYCSLCRNRRAPYDSYIFPLSSLIKKLFAKMCLCIRGLGYDKETGRILVYSVHKPKPWVIYIIAFGISEMPCKGVDKRTAIIPMPRMHDKPSRLIHNHNCIILIDHIQWDILRDNLKIVSGTVHHHAHHIQRLHTVVGFYWLSIYEHTACISSLLHPVSGRFFQTSYKELVNPKELLTLIRDKTEMLI